MLIANTPKVMSIAPLLKALQVWCLASTVVLAEILYKISRKPRILSMQACGYGWVDVGGQKTRSGKARAARPNIAALALVRTEMWLKTISYLCAGKHRN
jgi:hypothetical protein